ncbi:hypothetical protein U9M48_041644 [Paspalum notatum var. saurae]|uniref:Reverse transcriptase zinc-binding domain-containing protein n=1 Tax=Paspalum notatum var. saurae TaxID=547442 RepID=A0AAQ3UQW7_PASNO
MGDSMQIKRSGRKWLFKLANEDGTWQRLLRNKYLRNKTWTQLERKPGDSQFWSSLMGVKDEFLNLGSFIVKNGTQVRFWEDIWLEGVALKHQFPSLFNIVRKKQATVAEVLGSSPLNVSFRRSLVGTNIFSWENLVAKILNLHLTEGNDQFKWLLDQSSNFSVRPMYSFLINTGIKASMEIWHTSWVKQGGLKKESLLLFGATGLFWALWLSRNEVVFDKCTPKSFLQVLFRGTYWLRLWAKLQRSEESKQGLLQACRILVSAFMQLFSSFGWPDVARISFPF